MAEEKPILCWLELEMKTRMKKLAFGKQRQCRYQYFLVSKQLKRKGRWNGENTADIMASSEETSDCANILNLLFSNILFQDELIFYLQTKLMKPFGKRWKKISGK